MAVVAGIGVVASAHVGSPDAWYAGTAGPWQVLVQVEAPSVVPGIAKVNVVVEDAGVTRVTARVNKFDATAASPPPDVAVRDPGNPTLYSTELWVMSSGSNAVTVEVKGDKGDGVAVIPVVIVQTHVLRMERGMGALLGAVGLFLVAGLLTIVGAAVRESVLPPGDSPDAARRARAKRVMAIAAVLLVAALAGGWKWWNSEENAYRRGIFKPFTATAAVTTGDAPAVELRVADSVWVRRRDSAWLSRNGRSTFTPLIPDHGKLMHLFLIGGPGNAAFAHLHPATSDSVLFSAPLPPLPAGKYRAFGDIVHESGFSQTLVSGFELASAVSDGRKAIDPDDSWHVAEPSTAPDVTLADGSTLSWARAARPLTTAGDASLRFRLVHSDGRPGALEPYMGMAGHAVVMRDDGQVFIHLHPSGTISMASQKTFEMRQPGDSIAGTLARRLVTSDSSDHSAHAPPVSEVWFPYAFRKPGVYHIWVQVRSGGRVLTGSWKATVAAEGS